MAGESAAEIARRQRERAARLQRSADAWERGADGERLTGEQLDRLKSLGWAVFHDLRWPGRPRANIDHVAIGPNGVFVVDTKNWSGEVKVIDDVLHQGGRRREREVAAAAEAGLAVTQLLGGTAAIPVLCFVGAEPLGGWARDVLVSSTSELAARLLSEPPTLTVDAVRRLTRVVDRQMGSAARPAPTSQVFASRIDRASGGAARRPVGPVRSRSKSAAVPLGRRLTRAVLGLVLLIVGSIVALSMIGTGLKAATSHLGTAGSGDEASGGAVPVLGKAIRLGATADHPAVVLNADKVVRLRSTKPDYPLQAGRHLVGVHYTIRNLGDRLWGVTPQYLQLSMLASNGEPAAHGSYSALAAGRLLPAAFNLGAGKTRRGYVVFSVANGSKPVRVAAALSYGSGATATWLVP